MYLSVLDGFSVVQPREIKIGPNNADGPILGGVYEKV